VNEIKNVSMGSNGEKGVSPSTSRINVSFARDRLFYLPIQHVMKTSFQVYPAHPALFKIAARIENSTAPWVFESHPDVIEAAFANLRLAAVKSKIAKNKKGSDANATDSGLSKGHAMRTDSPNNSVTRKRASRPVIGLKKAEFHLIAPFAKSVKLAADFTEWEQFPLDLVKSEGGVWYTVVPLPPGSYSYRFIVDGQWCDDPHPARRVHNDPFGTASAVVEVI
jgi:hypothetical protein